MILTIRAFSGEQPRIAPSLLPDAAAQVALDCEFSSGELRATKGLSTAVKNTGGLSNPTGFFACDDGNLFTWTGLGWTIAKSPVIGDFYERVYFTNAVPAAGGTTRHLRVVEQSFAMAGVGIWDATKTYAGGEEVTYPGTVPSDYNAALTYEKGDLVRYPVGVQPVATNNIVYRSLRDNNLANTPGSAAAWWQLYGLGVRYEALQSGNTNKVPGAEPLWWRPNARSLVGVTTRAGVPPPAAWTAKLYGVGTYNVNVVTGDLTGAISAYNVPAAVADERAAVDGSLTNIKNSNALIAVARNTWVTNLVLKASPADAANTAKAYFAANGVKQQEEVVTLYPIEPARLYSFDPPQKIGRAHV